MPELPEVETMRRGLLPILGKQVVAVRKPRCERRPIRVRPGWPTLRRQLVGRTIIAVDRFGKRVVLVWDDRSRLVIEPRMTGLVVLADPPTRDHLRLELVFANQPPVWFWDRRGLGTVTWMPEADYEALTASGRLGPDALTVDRDEFRARLARSAQPIKVVLLDQKRLAGIGNLYASEILYVAGVDPRRIATEIDSHQWERLWQATRDVLTEAIVLEGSTLGDGTYRTALGQPGRYQNRHRVYAKAGAQCPRCAGALSPIVRIVQAQRATFYCGGCQT